MYVATFTKIEHDRTDGEGTLTISLKMDVAEFVREAGDSLWDHIEVEDAADHFGTDLVDHLDASEVLDAFSIAEKCESVEAEEVADWLANEGYTVAEPAEGMVMVPRTTIEALRTVVGAARQLLDELD